MAEAPAASGAGRAVSPPAFVRRMKLAQRPATDRVRQSPEDHHAGLPSETAQDIVRERLRVAERQSEAGRAEPGLRVGRDLGVMEVERPGPFDVLAAPLRGQTDVELFAPQAIP